MYGEIPCPLRVQRVTRPGPSAATLALHAKGLQTQPEFFSVLFDPVHVASLHRLGQAGGSPVADPEDRQHAVQRFGIVPRPMKREFARRIRRFRPMPVQVQTDHLIPDPARPGGGPRLFIDPAEGGVPGREQQSVRVWIGLDRDLPQETVRLHMEGTRLRHGPDHGPATLNGRVNQRLVGAIAQPALVYAEDRLAQW